MIEEAILINEGDFFGLNMLVHMLKYKININPRKNSELNIFFNGF